MFMMDLYGRGGILFQRLGEPHRQGPVFVREGFLEHLEEVHALALQFLVHGFGRVVGSRLGHAVEPVGKDIAAGDQITLARRDPRALGAMV